MGASVTKIEPLAGDPFEQYHRTWYDELCLGITVQRLDLKSEAGAERLAEHLRKAHLLVTSQRPGALARLGLDWTQLSTRHPQLSHVALTGHATRSPDADRAGHDITYGAEAGIATAPDNPPTLFVDVAASEQLVATALECLWLARCGQVAYRELALAEVARRLAEPRRRGLTAPGGILSDANPLYRYYASQNGFVALAALEPHFAQRVARAMAPRQPTAENLARFFAEHTSQHWRTWADAVDVPLSVAM